MTVPSGDLNAITADTRPGASSGLCGTHDAARRTRARIVFLVQLHPGAEEKFLAAYESIRYLVADGAPGHLVDQVCESADTPGEWLITSEWERLEDFYTWERTPEHRELVGPLRNCIAAASSRKFLIRRETGHVGDTR